MLAQLSTLKSRPAITVTDYDTILTNALTAISGRFDKECNRTFTRTTSALHEFDTTDVEISVGPNARPRLGWRTTKLPLPEFSWVF